MLNRAFFERDPVACARDLVGRELRWRGCAGVIVETEAYAAEGDEACHTFARPSARRFVAEHPPGTAYVYFNYGMYWLFNVLVKGGAADGFVLVRAVEPTRGIPAMRARRGRDGIRDLCSGPGKLAQAFGITGADHGADLCAGRTTCLAGRAAEPSLVAADRRVGISKARDLPWRFLLGQSPYLSRPPHPPGAAA
jgi:DNA-3-methyladenine glycosylase